MAEEVNWNEKSDDDFIDALEAAGSNPVDEDKNTEDTEPNDETSFEEDVEAETNEQIDDEAQDSDETFEEKEDESEVEDSQIEDEDREEPEDEKSDESKDEAETEDGETSKADKINYEEEYKKILEEKAWFENFYNEATQEFTANGRKVKGFDDPKKIIEAQQMAAGFSDKMAGFKQYKPFMKTLKEKGILESPEKFNFAMQLLEGDPEAIKKQIKDLEIDPFEMDMENINYQEKNSVSNDIEIAFDEVMESASQHGVSDQVQNIISKDWDDDSVIELLSDAQNSSDLIDHIESGAYDIVQDRIAEKKRTDVSGVYGSKNKIQQYREAAMELEHEYKAYLEQNAQEQQYEEEQYAQPDIAGQQEREEYAQKVEKQKAKTDEARRKATSLSKKKRGTRKPKKEIDPLKLDDDGFTNYLDNLIYS